jgi:cell division protein FtsW
VIDLARLHPLAPLNRLRGWLRARADDRAAGRATAALPVRDHVATPGLAPTRLLAFDRTLVLVAVALVLAGLVMVYSASIALPDSRKFAAYSPTYFLSRHLLAVAIGAVVALAVVQVPVSVWEKHAPLIFLVALALLVAVLLPFVGVVRNNSRRWIPLGFMMFQPAELAKLAMAMYAASYIVRRMATSSLENFFAAVWPMVVALAFTGALLLRQPDMGAFIVIAVIAMGILFLGGVNARMFLLVAAVIVATFALIIAFDDLRRERIFAYLDPWNPAYVQGKAYQLTHSLIAFGRGGCSARGWAPASRSCTTCRRRTPTSCSR